MVGFFGAKPDFGAHRAAAVQIQSFARMHSGRLVVNSLHRDKEARAEAARRAEEEQQLVDSLAEEVVQRATDWAVEEARQTIAVALEVVETAVEEALQAGSRERCAGPGSGAACSPSRSAPPAAL